MHRWFVSSLICLALLTQLAIPASEQRLSGDPVFIPSGHLKLKDYMFCGAKPSVPSYMLFGDDGTASWSAASGMAGGCNWERDGTTLVPAVAGDDVEIDGSSLFAGVLFVTNSSSGAGIMGASTDGVGIRGASTNAVGLEGSSGAANGIEGWTEGAGNTVYSIAAVPDILATTQARTLLGDYADLTDTDDPAWPASGYGRLYIGYSSKLHWLLSDGTDYDLTAGAGGMSSWLAAADWGSDQTVTNGYSLNFVGGTGISTTNTPLAQCLTIDLDDTAVTPGSYTLANITVDQQGRITAAANGTDNTGYAQVQKGGSPLTARGKLNFVGAGFTGADDPIGARTNIDLAAILNTLGGLANAPGYLYNNGSGTLSYSTPASGASTSAAYLTQAAEAGLSAERVLTAGVGVTLTDGGANSTLTVAAPLTEGAGLNVVSGGAGGAYTLSSKNPWTHINKTSDQSLNSNTTPANDNTLTLSASANSTYLFKGVIFYTTGATEDFKWSILDTQIPVLVRGKDAYIIPGAATTQTNTARVAYPANIALAGTGTTGGWIEFNYVITTHATNASTIGFAWSQNTSGATNTTVLKGSHIEWMKL